MSIVSYSDVSFILDNCTVWSEGHEQYWYQKAWSVLESQGATQFSSQKEYYRKLLYAFALVHVYDEFCGYAFGEERSTFFQDYLEGEISPVLLGQLVVEFLNTGEVVEDENDALMFILNALKYEVFRVIKADMTVSDVFAWMYCTGFTPYQDIASQDDEEDPEDPVEYDIGCFEDYRKMIESTAGEVLNDWSDDRAEAYDYLVSLM